MGKATKAAGNPCYNARISASGNNDNFASREKTAEIIGIERTRLARIELASLIPYPEEVLMMSDAYNAPELLNHHCTTDCPIGRQMLVKADVKNLEQIAVNAYNALKSATEIKEEILDIAADGKINDDEKPRLKKAMEQLSRESKSCCLPVIAISFLRFVHTQGWGDHLQIQDTQC